jgi:hypothetical protein
MKHIKATVLSALVVWMVLQIMVNIPALAQPLNLNVVTGEWARTDGNYTILVRDVKPDGSADVGYYNPGEIHVAESNVSVQKSYIKLFVKLQDKGYPGSTYTLYYYAEEDALVGFYYQAALDQTFEVIFIRNKAALAE